MTPKSKPIKNIKVDYTKSDGGYNFDNGCVAFGDPMEKIGGKNLQRKIAREKYNAKKTKGGNTDFHRMHDGKMAWQYPNDALITLCGECHKDEHSIVTGDVIIDAGLRIKESIYSLNCLGYGKEIH